MTRNPAPNTAPQPSPTIVTFEDMEAGEVEECPRCKKLTDGELATVFPGSTADVRALIIKAFNDYAPKFHIDTCLRKAHFFAQAKQESGDGLMAALEGESMNYSEHGLLNTGFKNVSARPDGRELAKQVGRPDKYDASGKRIYKAPTLTLEQQIKVANFIYGLNPKAVDLGNHPPHTNNASLDSSENEGWQFKGRGMTQVTGRNNYKKAQDWIEKILRSKPIDIAEGKTGTAKFTGDEAALSGFADWDMDNMWTYADTGCTKAACQAIIAIINSQTKSKEKRVANLIGSDWTMDDLHGNVKDADCMKTVFKVEQCTKDKNAQIGDGKWHDPVDNPQLRGWYGDWNPSESSFGYVRRNGKRVHQGYDLYANVGSMVYACVSGEIVRKYKHSDYGDILVLKGKYGDTTYYFFYAHLSQRSKNVGDNVTAGDPIGETGKTGNAKTLEKYQEHLHFEIRTRPDAGLGLGGRLGPASIISELNNDNVLKPKKENQPK